MVLLSASQQVLLAFTALLFTFAVLPRLFGVNGGGTNWAKDARADPRHNRKGPGRGSPMHLNSPGAQSAENMQNMKKLMEQGLKSDTYNSNNNKGYVFTLMPLYAIGVGVFAAYKFLKIKSADDQAQRERLAKGAKKSVEAEKQLNELEQRLAQTERMLNSILTQLDPLTNCVKSVAQEQKNEIMNQLQTIRILMKKRGMDCSPLNTQDGSCERNLNNLIESLGAKEASSETNTDPVQPICKETPAEEPELGQKTPENRTEEEEEEEEPEEAMVEKEEEPLEEDAQEGAWLEQEVVEEEDVSLLEDSVETEEKEAEPVSGLRRRNRHE